MLTPLFLVSSAAKPRLRIGILIDGFVMPRYIAAILADLARSNFVEIALTIIHRSDEPPGSGTVLSLGRRISGAPYQLYVGVDRAIGGEGDPLSPVDAEEELSSVDCLEVPSSGEKGELRLPAAALSEILSRDLDVILRFCQAVPRGEVLHAARYGVWSYRYGNDDHPLVGAPFLRQLADRASILDVTLTVLEEETGLGLTLCQSRFVEQKSMFVARSRQIAFWETTHFILLKLHELHEKGWAHLQKRAESLPPPPSAETLAHTPTTLEMVRLLVPRVLTKIKNRLQSQPPGPNGRWILGTRRADPPLASVPNGVALSGFRWHEPPRGHFWADPFLVKRHGQTFLFFEDFDAKVGYATISRALVLPDGGLGPVEGCLDPGYHVSYPFVFKHEGEMFMIPESSYNGTVTLYRARRFPDDWVQEKVLFRGNAVDTTLFQKDGRFYFFTTLYDRDDRGMTTMLFLADSLTGAWRYHPANPISTDVREARQAGAIFLQEGRLFRPAQNCAPHYGYGFSLREILALSEDQYEERLWCSVEPTRLPIPASSVHTYNKCGNLEVIDCCSAMSQTPDLRAEDEELPYGALEDEDEGSPSSRAAPSAR